MALGDRIAGFFDRIADIFRTEQAPSPPPQPPKPSPPTPTLPTAPWQDALPPEIADRFDDLPAPKDWGEATVWISQDGTATYEVEANGQTYTVDYDSVRAGIDDGNYFADNYDIEYDLEKDYPG